MVALDPDDGSVVWERNYDELAEQALPALPAAPPLFPTGQPIARFNSVVSLSARKVWVALTLGYEFLNPLSGLRTVQPQPDSEIYLLGYDTPLAWTYTDADGLTITIPDALQDEANRPGKYAYAFKIKIAGG